MAGKKETEMAPSREGSKDGYDPIDVAMPKSKYSLQEAEKKPVKCHACE